MSAEQSLDYVFSGRKDVAKALVAVMITEIREAISLTEDEKFVNSAKDELRILLSAQNRLRSEEWTSAELDLFIERGRVLLTNRWLVQAGFQKR